MSAGLPFREVWLCDFEFSNGNGDPPVPACMVAMDWRTGRQIRMWHDELYRADECPFDVGEHSLFVAFQALAECSCFLSLGWTLPARIYDTAVEFKAQTNGRLAVKHGNLLDALHYFGIPGITHDEKKAGQRLGMQGAWTPAERQALLDYCATDTEALGPLLDRLLLTTLASPRGLGQALLRGRFEGTAAQIERVGIPIDVATLGKIREHSEQIKLLLIAESPDEFKRQYEGTTFKIARFGEYLDTAGINDWPVTATGQLELRDDTFREMAVRYPQLTPLRKLRGVLNDLQSEDLRVGADGRNRTPLWPYTAKTGRNAPSGSEYILNRGAWMRNLIQPPPGIDLYYVDWVAQEVVIAAVLSGDKAMLDAARSGDPYLALAIHAGDAPAGATKHSHGDVRRTYKEALLGSFYGMQSRTLARQLRTNVVRAGYVLRQIAEQFPNFWAWAKRMEDVGQLYGGLVSCYGWPLHVHDETKSNTVRNFTVQANGSEMMRLAAYNAVQGGVRVCALLHDAMLVEAGASDGPEILACTRAAMDEASAAVLDGEIIATDVDHVIRYPGRFPAPQETWRTVDQLLSSHVRGQYPSILSKQI